MAAYTTTTPGTRSGVTAPSRRDLLGAAGFIALAGIAAVAIAKPDVEAAETFPAANNSEAALLAHCARFLALQVDIDQTYDEEVRAHRLAKKEDRSSKRLLAMEEAHEAEREPWCKEQRDFIDEIDEMSAKTLAGQRSRARVVMAWCGLHRPGVGSEFDVIEWKHLLPLFSDLLGEEV